MALGDLFKSKNEREKEVQKKRRKAFREAESAVDDVRGRVEKMKRRPSSLKIFFTQALNWL